MTTKKEKVEDTTDEKPIEPVSFDPDDKDVKVGADVNKLEGEE